MRIADLADRRVAIWGFGREGRAALAALRSRLPQSQFTVFFRNNRLACDFAYGETMDIAAIPSVGQWHVIQAIVYYGSTTYTSHVSYDGGAAKMLSVTEPE